MLGKKPPKAVGPDSIWVHVYNEYSDSWTYGVRKNFWNPYNDILNYSGTIWQM